MEYLGRFWNDKTKDIYRIDNKNIMLNKWNGETYYECYVLKDNLIDIIQKDIEVAPVYKQNEVGEYELVDYKII